ncbi:hypothetical protein FHT78_005435 [Rhizobium sp. BK196]|uniref:hypothetical protein n=1 Tax=Rhizobium sp. BK196 TaxID=2587073 RepID=UPI001611D963|nr:hypothetical protein [Rhizobium sp. BK196]MBB3313641.1 hypothetical protein [Rhizobium sp. BK196]
MTVQSTGILRPSDLFEDGLKRIEKRLSLGLAGEPADGVFHFFVGKFELCHERRL